MKEKMIMRKAIMDNIRKYTSFLNPALVKQQKLTSKNYAALVESHQLKNVIFIMAENTENVETLRMLAKMFDELEFEQQRLWGFPLDQNYHYFWDFPACTCPKIDNLDSLGTSYHVHSGVCPIHGETVMERVKARLEQSSKKETEFVKPQRDAKGRFIKNK